MLDFNSFPVIFQQSSWSHHLREQVIKHLRIVFLVLAISLTPSTREEIPHEELAPAQQLEHSLHVSILGFAYQPHITVESVMVLHLLSWVLCHFIKNDVPYFIFPLQTYVSYHKVERIHLLFNHGSLLVDLFLGHVGFLVAVLLHRDGFDNVLVAILLWFESFELSIFDCIKLEMILISDVNGREKRAVLDNVQMFFENLFAVYLLGTHFDEILSDLLGFLLRVKVELAICL